MLIFNLLYFNLKFNFNFIKKIYLYLFLGDWGLCSIKKIQLLFLNKKNYYCLIIIILYNFFISEFKKFKLFYEQKHEKSLFDYI